MSQDTEEYKGYVIRIRPDDMFDNPRTAWDNLATIVCVNHPRYKLGDVQTNDVASYLQSENIAVCLPVYMYDHNNIALSTKNTYPFNDMWDAGCVGAIFVSREIVKKEYGWIKITAERKAKLIQYLQSEIEVYSNYLNGNVYGFILENEQGEELESCWGFYGYDECLTEAKSQIDYYVIERQKAQDWLDKRVLEYASA